MASAEKNRCVVDAGRFCDLVIDILLDTICDVISSLKTHRNSSAILLLWPEGHSLVGACGSVLWQKIRDRWRARRAERETKTHQTATWRVEGRRDDGGTSSGQKGTAQGANKSTDAKLHNKCGKSEEQSSCAG